MKPSSLPFAALCFGLLIGAGVSTSCGPSRPMCTPTSCNGCCDSSSGLCVSITTSTQCGSRGETCKACSLGQSCSFGACTGGNNTGAGTSGGGFATGGGTGGGFATGGGTGGGFTTGGGTGGGFATGGGTGGGFATGGGTGGGFATGGGTGGGGVASCNTGNCQTGCCQGSTCVMPPSNAFNTSCGFGGLACSNCSTLGQVCNNVTFTCMSGTGGGAGGGGAGGGGSTILGDNCAGAIPLTLFSGTASTSGSLAGLSDDSSVCAGTGPDAVYQVTLSAPATITAQVTATGFTPRISVRSFCTNTTTLACETSTATTTQLGAGTYFIWVDSSSSTASGSYSLSITTSGAGGGGAGGGFGGGGTGGGVGGGSSSGTYVASSITANCDTVTSGFQEVDAITDDGATVGQSLPFGFTFYGTPMSAYAVASNGLLQLGTTSTISTVSSGSNASSFTANSVANAVAPFWDDLENSATADVRSTTLGSGSTQRFVVEWKDFAFYSSSGPTADRLTFQAKLFANGVIEFHYCSMTGSATRHQGDSATIGIGTGSSALQQLMQSVNMASVSSGAGFRFTP